MSLRVRYTFHCYSLDNAAKTQNLWANSKFVAPCHPWHRDISPSMPDVGGLKQDVSELKSDVAIIKVELVGLKDSQVRLESEFHNQITALHDFRVGQEK